MLAQYGEFGPDLPIGTNNSLYSGSGCTVEGDVLPDGIWFGHILEYEIAAEPSPVDFDLACARKFRSQNIVSNQSGRVRDVGLTGDTRFVFVRDLLVLSPSVDSAEIGSRLADQFDAGWGWAVIESGEMVEFYIPDLGDWRGGTEREMESTIPGILYPQNTDEVLTAADGFDGSGCSPEGDSLPDGLWFGRPRFTATDRVQLDLWCSVSSIEQMLKVGIDPGLVEDRTAIDDGSDAEFELAIAADAVLHLTFFDRNLFQTPLTTDDPRYLHMVAGPQPAFQQWTPGLWVRVVDGEVVEGYNFFSP
ncbi:MAG: hypothetical protein HKN91_01815 [Acidimicrobiia bacterium]|nr:hypothetical protein [Acidimicrobiia bacterium]